MHGPVNQDKAQGIAGAYVPISCVEHERLEVAVLRRQRLRLHLRTEAGNATVVVVSPLDVNTRGGAEWLSIEVENGERAVIRLDRITLIENL